MFHSAVQQVTSPDVAYPWYKEGSVVKFGLDITRIPLRTDGRWKAYL